MLFNVIDYTYAYRLTCEFVLGAHVIYSTILKSWPYTPPSIIVKFPFADFFHKQNTMSNEENIEMDAYPEPLINRHWPQENTRHVCAIIVAITNMRAMEMPTPVERYTFFEEMLSHFENLRSLGVNPFWFDNFFMCTVSELLDRLTGIYWNVMVNEAQRIGAEDVSLMITFLGQEMNRAYNEMRLLIGGMQMIRCYVCMDSHKLKNCRFIFSSRVKAKERLEKLAEFNVCLNCLKQKRDGHTCLPPLNRCANCDGQHDTRFHEDLLEVENLDADLTGRMEMMAIDS